MLKSLKDMAYRFLRWSERYTRTDMVYAAHGGFWLMVERVATLLAGFAMAIAFANLMEPEKYGVYKYALSMMGIIGAFSLAGMNTAVNQAVARGFEGALIAGFRTSLRWSIGMLTLAFLVAAYYFVRDNQVLGTAFLIGGSLTPVIAGASLYDNFLAGSQRFSVKAVYGALRNVIPPLLLIATLFISQDPIALVAVYFTSTAAVTYFCYRDVVRRFTPTSATDPATLSFSKHLSAMNILDILAAQADRVFIFSQLGGTALAMYSFAEMVPDQVRGLSSITGTLALPKLSRTPFNDLKRTLPRKALVMFLIALASVVVYAALAPWFFSVFFPKYVDAVPLSQVYALTILSMPSVLFSRALIGHMKKFELYTLKIVSPLIKITLMLILLHLYGLWGVVYATLLSYVIGGALLMILFYRARDNSAPQPSEA